MEMNKNTNTNYNEPENFKKLVEPFKQNNDWQGLFKVCASVQQPKSDLVLQNYGYAASKMMDECEKMKIADAHRKYFKICVDAYKEILQRHPDCDGQPTKFILETEKMLAYTYYKLYQGFGNLNKNTSMNVVIEKYRAANLAEYLYRHILENQPNCLKSSYRLGRLLMYRICCYTKENKELGNTFPEYYSAHPTVKQHMLYLDKERFISKEQLDKYKENYYLDVTPNQYFKKAIDVYQNIQSEEVRNRVKNEYYKSIYNMCKFNVDYSFYRHPEIIPLDSLRPLMMVLYQYMGLDKLSYASLESYKAYIKDSFTQRTKCKYVVEPWYMQYLVAKFNEKYLGDNAFSDIYGFDDDFIENDAKIKEKAQRCYAAMQGAERATLLMLTYRLTWGGNISFPELYASKYNYLVDRLKKAPKWQEAVSFGSSASINNFLGAATNCVLNSKKVAEPLGSRLNELRQCQIPDGCKHDLYARLQQELLVWGNKQKQYNKK